jgi:ribonucleoside-triphosphate reductase
MGEENLSNVIVIKRDGKRVSFDGTKIAIAIKKGFDSVEEKYSEDDINKIYNKVISRIISLNKDKIKIEEIQDMIEIELKSNKYDDVYQSFSEYREKRTQSREIFFEEKRKHKFLKALEKLGLKTKENVEASIENKNAMQTMEAYGKTVSEEFATSYLMKKKFADSHENGDIFITDQVSSIINNYNLSYRKINKMIKNKEKINGINVKICKRIPKGIRFLKENN